MLVEWFAGLPGVARVMLMLCTVAVLGLALGHVRVRGVGLGIGGVLFAGIAVGHLAGQAGLEFDHAMLELIREFGLILFVYTIGNQVGPGFFGTLRRSGLTLNLLAAALVGLGVLVAAGLHVAGGLPLPVVLGLFSGAVTNTPSLGAAQQVLKEVGAGADALALPSLGYAVAYPFGIAGILLAMTLVRLLWRIDPAQEAEAFECRRRSEVDSLAALDIAIRNPNLDGLTVRELPGLERLGVVASRMLHDGRLQVPRPETRVRLGDVLHLVGPRPKLEEMRLALGQEASVTLTTKGTDLRWERLVVTNSHVLGKSFAQLNILDAYDVVVSRVTRAGVELVPTAALKLEFGDILTAIGKPADIQSAAAMIGNSERRLQEVQLIPVFVGIALGLLLGSLPLVVPGMPAALKLGLAGGPLVAAIVLSRLGHVGPLVWFMPPAASNALRELGIVLFLAAVGFRSGDRFVETLVNGDGLVWMTCGALITLVPLLVVGLFARAVLKLNYLSLCGLLSGSMTDPPALAFANALSPSQAPALAYATVYPLVMCLRILAPQILVLFLWA